MITGMDSMLCSGEVGVGLGWLSLTRSHLDWVTWSLRQYTFTIIVRSLPMYAGGGLPTCRATHARHDLSGVPDRYSGRHGWGLGVRLNLIT
jgi:hypothetical protein